MGAEIAIAGLVLSAIGTVSQISSQKKAAKSRQRADRARQRQEDLRQARQRRSTIREARQRRAQVQSATTQQGVGASSAAAGAVGSVGSQAAGALSFLDTQAGLAREATAALAQASTFDARARFGGQIAQTGGTIFSQSGDIADIFK